MKKKLIVAALILGSNFAGTKGVDLWNWASWGVNKTGSALVWVSNIGHSSKS